MNWAADLLGANEVYGKVMSKRVQQLAEWKTLLALSGRMVLDIPHPNRVAGALKTRKHLWSSVSTRWGVTQVARIVSE